MQINRVAGPVKVTDAAPDADVECIYMTVWCEGVPIPDVLGDGRAILDLIAKDVVESLDLEKHPVHDLGMRLADDNLVPLESYVWLDGNVEGVVARVQSYVIPVTVTYTLILSRRYLKRMKGVVHHSPNMLIIPGMNGAVQSTKSRPAPPAELPIVELKEALQSNSTKHGDDKESADDAVNVLLHLLDDW